MDSLVGQEVAVGQEQDSWASRWFAVQVPAALKQFPGELKRDECPARPGCQHDRILAAYTAAIDDTPASSSHSRVDVFGTGFGFVHGDDFTGGTSSTSTKSGFIHQQSSSQVKKTAPAAFVVAAIHMSATRTVGYSLRFRPVDQRSWFAVASAFAHTNFVNSQPCCTSSSLCCHDSFRCRRFGHL